MKQKTSSEKKTRSNFLKQHWSLIIGTLFLALIPIWFFGIVPEIIEMRENFSYDATVTSYDNLYDEQADTYGGLIQSNTSFSFQTTQVHDNILDIENVFDVRTLSGEKIFSVERIYGINQYTRQHDPNSGDTERFGYLFAPRMKGPLAQAPDKSSFTYWHINYNTPIHVVFEAEEDIFGVPTYRYHATFLADQTDSLGHLPGVGTTRGVNLDVEITLWVEPYSGHLVQYTDSAIAYYYDLETKERIHPWNQFSNQYTDTSASRQALVASLLKQKMVLVSIIIPILLLILSLIFFTQKILRDILDKLEERPDGKKRTWLFPTLIFSISFIGSIFLYLFISNIILDIRQTEFDSEVERISDSLTDRLEIYTNALRGGRGLFDASDNVSRHEWNQYVESLDIQKNYPGVQAFGYAIPIATSTLTAHIESIRAEGFSDYTVYPKTPRSEYTSIVYIEPFDKRNQEAFGFDMFQEPIRHKAMTRARDTNQPAMSGRITLVQEIDEDVQPGFLIYVPVYKKNTSLTTPTERRNALTGFVYAAFRMNNFMRGALPTHIDSVQLRIHDAESLTEATTENQMYSNGTQSFTAFTSAKEIEFAGKKWIIQFSAPTNYHTDTIRTFGPPFSLTIGTLFSVFLFVLFYGFNNRRTKAIELANSMTQDLRIRTEQNEAYQQELTTINKTLKEQAKALQEKVAEVEKSNKYMIGRETKMIELKEQIKRLQKKKPKKK